MKKLMIAQAVALLFSGVALAESNIQTYGFIDMGVQVNDAKHSPTSVQLKPNNEGGSRWGIKGTEDLGRGNSIFFVLEMQFKPDTGEIQSFHGAKDDYWGRQSLLGVAGKYGQFLMGRMYSGTSPAGVNQTLALTDAFKCAWLDASTLTLSAENTLRLNNAIQYASPVIGGFKSVLTYSLSKFQKEELAPMWKNNRLFDIAITHKTAKSYWMVGFNKTFSGSDYRTPEALQRQVNFVTGGNYDFGPFKLFATYRFGRHLNTAGTSFKGNSDWTLNGGAIGVNVPVQPSGLIRAQVLYGHATSKSDKGGSFNKVGAGLGYQYFLSKRTDVYAVVSYAKANGAAKDAASENRMLYTVGMMHKF